MSQNGTHGCKHSFTWTANTTASFSPPEASMTWCAACGTWATWKGGKDGGWRPLTESPGSLAMGQAERFGNALSRIFGCLGPSTPDPKLDGAAEGMGAEIDEALSIIREVHGVVPEDSDGGMDGPDGY